MPKRTIYRKQYIALRRQMSKEDVASKSAAICEKILDSMTYKTAQVIVAYYPLGNEVNCLPILEHALNAGKHVMLPRTEADCQMDFYEIGDFSDVKEGNFHVMEPKEHCCKFKPDQFTVDTSEGIQDIEQKVASVLVLVPGVAFDYEGNRYGYGKGYYDRYFLRFPQLKRVALAYTEQMSEETLECLETDVKMHAIVTEQEILVINEAVDIKKQNRDLMI